MLANFGFMTEEAEKDRAQYEKTLFGRPVEYDQHQETIYPSGLAEMTIYGSLQTRRTKRLEFYPGDVYGELSRQIIRFLKQSGVTSIAVLFNSTGGDAIGCSECADIIINAGKIKPITALIQGDCLSGAYWLASACNRILLSGETVTVGGIGIIRKRTSETDEEAAIESGELKSAFSSPPTPAKEGYIKLVTESALNTFIEAVRVNRNLSAEQVGLLASGEGFIGKSAIVAGLADGYYSPYEYYFSNKIVEVSK